MPVLLDEAMRPIEPLSSWFRNLAVMGRSPEAMHKYAYFNDPMREVDEAFRARTTHEELTYAEIGHQLLTRAERDGDAPARVTTGASHTALDRQPPPARIGIRRVAGTESHGNPGSTSIDPGRFACSGPDGNDGGVRGNAGCSGQRRPRH
jgi:hypothetical protein